MDYEMKQCFYICKLHDMKKYTSLQGFTLVELIVVITILAILGTIGYISLVRNNADARDAVRQTDLNQISKTMNMQIDTGENHEIWEFITTPLPENMLSTGTIGGKNLSEYSYSVGQNNPMLFTNETFIDPKTNTPYPIWVVKTPDGVYYQVAATLESAEALVEGNYFQASPADVPGIIKTASGSETVINNSQHIPYSVEY